jgi:hypothetical protein
MIVLYFLVIIKIVMMRYKVYHAKQTFSKNDQVLVIFIVITIARFFVFPNAFENMNSCTCFRCNTQTFLNFLRRNRFLHQFFKVS